MNSYIGNAFSLQMLEGGNAHISVKEIAVGDAAAFAKNATSCVGHPDTAAVFSEQLRVTVPMNRMNVKLNAGDNLIVGQLTGGRLPEGATTLPEGFKIEWKLVTVERVSKTEYFLAEIERLHGEIRDLTHDPAYGGDAETLYFIQQRLDSLLSAYYSE